jgi:hypothetical protein
MDWVCFVALFLMVTVWLAVEVVPWLIGEMRSWGPEDWHLLYLSTVLVVIWLLAKKDD